MDVVDKPYDPVFRLEVIVASVGSKLAYFTYLGEVSNLLKKGL